MAPRPDFLGLEAFVAVAEAGGFSAAAKRLGITQTALSHRMRKLEASLGFALFTRTTRHVALTPAGQDVLHRATALVNEARQTFADIGRTAARNRDRLAIGCLPTLAVHVLPTVLATFAESHPDVVVRVFDNSATEIAERVHRGEAAFGLTILSTELWDLQHTPLVEEVYVLVCRADHALARRRSVRWSALEGERIVRIAGRTGNRLLIDTALGEARERLKWAFEVQHVASAVALAAAGAGIAVVPRSAVRLVKAENAAVVALTHPAVTRSLGVLTRRGVPLSSTANSLLDLISTQLVRAIGKR